MKTFGAALIIASCLVATSASAGGLSDPVVEQDVIVEETASSSGDILVPILFLIWAGAVASS